MPRKPGPKGYAEIRPGKYQVRIHLNGRYHYFGVFDSPDVARKVYLRERAKLVAEEPPAERSAKHERIVAAAKAAWSGKRGEARRKKLRFTYGYE